MKKIITALLVLSMLFIFAGCGSRMANDVESGVESTIDSAEDAIENGLNGSQDNNNNNNNGNNNGSAADSATLSESEAKKTAFKHANVNETDAYDIDTELENDNGVLNYEISFETDSAEYDYHIHAGSGEIISSSKEEKKQTANR